MKNEPERLKSWLATVGAEYAFAALADSLPGAAVYAVDSQKKIVFWSEQAERLLGFRAEDVLGEHCLKGSRCEQCMGGCGISERGELRAIPLQMYRADGKLIPVKKTGRGFFDPNGRFLGGVEVLVADVETERQVPVPSAGLPLNSDQEPTFFHGLLTRDPRMRELLRTVRNVALSDATVLIRGESGSGKELIARGIHAESHRREGPFLAINCAAVAPSLLESELFGHEKGAFTGAIREHKGLFERASGGTLFLDEVAELPPDLQAKLLRVLQEQSFFRVGGTRPVDIDVRIVSATNRSLRKAVAEGAFRADLMYRLRVVPIFLPPLRERRTDIPLLVNHFLELLGSRGQRRIERVSPQAMRRLLNHAWPGNIRELQNVLEYAYVVGAGDEIGEADLPPEFHGEQLGLDVQPEMSGSYAASREAPDDSPADEKERILKAIETSGGNLNLAAERLGMSRATFWRKRKKFGI